MKKLLFIFVITMIMTQLKAQDSTKTAINKDSVYVIQDIDELANKTRYWANKLLVMTDGNRTGFGLSIHIGTEGEPSMLTSKSVNIGSCTEKDELIMLFTNGEKIVVKSWADFNCKGTGYYNLTDSQYDLLRHVEIKTIRITNGRSYESYTATVPNKSNRYFIQVLYALDHKLYKTVKE